VTVRLAAVDRVALATVAALALGGAGCGAAKRPATGTPAPSPPASARAGSPASLPARGPRVRLSSLHGRVAFTHRGDIWIARPDGSRARRLTRTRGPQDDPTWSPDGRTVAYRDARRGYNLGDEIYAIDADGSNPRTLTRTPFNEWSPAWSPDGRLIAFHASELYLIRPDGTRVRRLTQIEGEYPSWAPDGRRLAFMSAAPGARGANPDYEVFVVNVDGSRLTQLTDWPGEDGWPSWSPDGRWIAFSSSHDEAGDAPGRSIYLMRPDGSGKHRLALPLSATFPIWSPDGRTIMFTSLRGERLWVMRSDGTGWRQTPLDGGIAAWLDASH
jgi:Tol biopolymer transport system component